MKRALADFVVLDALANDIEDFESILRLANHPEIGWVRQHGAPIQSNDIIPALTRLIRDELVEACEATDGALQSLGLRTLPSGRFDDSWYRITERGRIVQQSWEPPAA